MELKHIRLGIAAFRGGWQYRRPGVSLAMHQLGTAPFWRKLAAGLAAYVIALQPALSGLALATLAASSKVPTAPICSEHSADPAQAPFQPVSDAGLCPCAPACMTDCSALSDPPAIAAFAPSAALPATLSRCRSAAVPKLTARGPQIPRAPPTV
jgi:hypothetical protein